MRRLSARGGFRRDSSCRRRGRLRAGISGRGARGDSGQRRRRAGRGRDADQRGHRAWRDRRSPTRSGEYAFASVEPAPTKSRSRCRATRPSSAPASASARRASSCSTRALEVGAIEESVTVSVQTPLVETANASHGAVLDRVALETLPSPGPRRVPDGRVSCRRSCLRRRPVQPAAGSDRTRRSLSLGGGTRRGNNYTLDGVSITDIVNRAVANPTMEALEDVKVQVHTYDAEMGRTGGGVFNTTLRSGTNTFRGTGVLPDTSAVGAGEQLLQRARRTGRSPTACTTSAAAASADRSSGTRRSSGLRPRTTTTSSRAASPRRFRPLPNAPATSRG